MKPGLNRNRTGSWLQISAVIAASLVAAATSRFPYETVPGWLITGNCELQIADLRAKVWIAKSGPGGVGITLRLNNTSEVRRTVRIHRAEFVTRGSVTQAKNFPQTIELGGGQTGYTYLPFLMDNRQNWEDQNRKGTIRIALSVMNRDEIEWVLLAEYVERRYRDNDGISDLNNEGTMEYDDEKRNRTDKNYPRGMASDAGVLSENLVDASIL